MVDVNYMRTRLQSATKSVQIRRDILFILGAHVPRRGEKPLQGFWGGFDFHRLHKYGLV